MNRWFFFIGWNWTNQVPQNCVLANPNSWRRLEWSRLDLDRWDSRKILLLNLVRPMIGWMMIVGCWLGTQHLHRSVLGSIGESSALKYYDWSKFLSVFGDWSSLANQQWAPIFRSKIFLISHRCLLSTTKYSFLINSWNWSIFCWKLSAMMDWNDENCWDAKTDENW